MGEGGSQETYSVRLKKISEIYGRPLSCHVDLLLLVLHVLVLLVVVVLAASALDCRTVVALQTHAFILWT